MASDETDETDASGTDVLSATEFSKPAHQGSLAHAKLSSNDLDPRLAGGKQLSQSPFHLVEKLVPLLWQPSQPP